MGEKQSQVDTRPPLMAPRPRQKVKALQDKKKEDKGSPQRKDKKRRDDEKREDDGAGSDGGSGDSDEGAQEKCEDERGEDEKREDDASGSEAAAGSSDEQRDVGEQSAGDRSASRPKSKKADAKKDAKVSEEEANDAKTRRKGEDGRVKKASRSDSTYGGTLLNAMDRAEVVCFFDGSSVADLLLEGSGFLRLPPENVADALEGFPHGFRDLSSEDGAQLLRVLANFSGPSDGEAGSFEIRQTLSVDKYGQRIMRKTLLINSEEMCAEEQALLDTTPLADSTQALEDGSA